MFNIYLKNSFFCRLLTKLQKNGLKTKYYYCLLNIFRLYIYLIKFLGLNYVSNYYKTLVFLTKNEFSISNTNKDLKKKHLVFFFKVLYLFINKQYFRKLKCRLLFLLNEFFFFYNNNIFLKIQKKDLKKIYIKKNLFLKKNSYLGDLTYFKFIK